MNEEQLDRELRFHFDQLVADYVRQGLTETEARRRAGQEFGGIDQVKEECRDARSTLWLDSTLQDIRFALRSMRKNAVLTSTVIATLALGIGVNTAIFSVVNAVLLRPLPYAQPDRLIALFETTPQLPRASASYLNYLDWRRLNNTCDELAALRWGDFNLTGFGDPERLHGRMVSASVFSMLGVSPVIGRTFTADEDRPGGRPVALISESLWRRRFGADTGILGRALTLNGSAYTVVGILPGSFQFPFRFGSSSEEVAVPLGQVTDPPMLDRLFHPGIRVVGRLKTGVAIETARADFTRVAKALAQEYPKANEGHGLSVTLLKDELVGYVRGGLYLLMGAVIFVLLIACANVANLLLARATAREQEIAMRSALGASRFRIVRQMLTESLLLAFAGGLLGLLLASTTTVFLVKSEARVLPRAEQITMDSRVLLFTFAMAVLTGFLFGLAPALQVSRSGIRNFGRGVVAGRRGFRDLLVVGQVTLALPLLVGGALLIRTLWNLNGVDPGFDPHHTLAIDVSLSPSAASTGPSIRRAYDDLIRRLENLPGIEAAAAVGNLPMTGDDTAAPISVEGRPVSKTQYDLPIGLLYPTTPDYLQVMKIPLLRGRFINEHDNLTSQPVMVIDETTARTLFPNEDPIGKRIVVGTGRPSQIIGVVAHVKHSGLDDDVTARFHLQLYYPVVQLPDAFLKFTVSGGEMFILRTRSNPLAVIDAVRNEIRSADADDVVSSIRAMDEIVAGTLASRRFLLTLLGTFAGIALLLASVGIYGVISYSVSQRTREIGIRMALGAKPGDILRSVVGQGALLSMAGIALGIIASVFLTRFMSGLLFGVGKTDPLTFSGVAIALTVVAVAASFLPALRGAKADPLSALRCE
ncbi:MAG: ABC transporter permease [Bryobacteraceae bacterium]|jgi:predicted permease